MNEKVIYNEWCQKVKDPVTLNELRAISDDDLEIVSRFSSFLEFGTAGARGIIGAGTNRINFVTVAHISKAFSFYLDNNFKVPSVAISYDTRRFSCEFAKIAAKVFAESGVLVYFFKNPSPIGLLSFAIRNLKCSAGVMITASHNPPEYNGYKIYNSLGAQPVDVSEISTKLKEINMFDIYCDSFETYFNKENIKFVPENVKFKYIENLQKTMNFENFENIDIVYSPLNGCSCSLFCDLFKKAKNLAVVSEQKYPDSSFKTCKKPDPQSVDSFKLSIKLAKKRNSDIIILNDPDGDRLGIALKLCDNYKILSGIEISALLLNYISQRRNVKDFIIAKSIVTGGLSEAIARFYGVHVHETLPGFKYISEFIHKLEKNGRIDRFLFGFEESNGFLLDTFVRDKDGISSAAFFCDMVSFYKSQLISCLDVLDNLYAKFGYHLQKNISFVKKNTDKIDNIMMKFKEYFISNNQNVVSISDYSNSTKVCFCDNSISVLDFPKSNTICIEFEKNNKIFVRASGTEPLIKVYILYNDISLRKAENLCNKFESFINKIWNCLI